MKNFTLIAIGATALFVVSTALFFMSNEKYNDTNMDDLNKTSKNPIAVLKTSKGDIGIELFVDKMPVTAGNFLKLAREGFYNDTKFHRVISNFMIQGGDPLSKSDTTERYGTGGPGYAIADEFVEGLSNIRGTISMANAGPNTGGSQFFINLEDNSGLDFDKEPFESSHPVFGKVVQGMDVVDDIGHTKTGEGDIPVVPVVVKSIEIVE